MIVSLKHKIENITAVGKRIAPALKKLGVLTAEDLLNYFPFRYEDWSRVRKIEELEPGMTATVEGQIEIIQNKRSQWKKRLVTEAIVTDGTESVKAIWFHQPYLIKNLRPGEHLFLSGKVEDKNGELLFIHPNYEKTSRYKQEMTHTARIVPIYSLTKNLTEKQLRYVMSQIIGLSHYFKDWLSEDIIRKNNLLPLSQAIKQIHFPDNQQNLNQALERIKFDELFTVQMRSALAKRALQQAQAQKIEFQEKETQKFVRTLPYSLTKAQKITGWEIIKDLGKNKPMNRLLEGDVGSGKTIVACLAILNTALGGYQTAYMAPTEILVRQHYENITKLFKDWPIKIALLTSADKRANIDMAADKEIYKQITAGKLDLVIGTHALIQSKVNFDKLALIIIDEQHRFGVGQRKALKQKNNDGTIPHLLSMTATPIPRSLALTAYGDLDLSVINEMPAGRKEIKTEIVPPERRPDKYKFVLEQIKAGRQAFVICPLIDPSDKLGVKAVKDEYEKLDKKIFPDLPIGLMHGKLKPPEKEKVMRDFLEQKTKILVSTPVIEVGIDVPNSTMILIESAERFGLAQLHQFRGRVGRSQEQSYCFLFTESNNVEAIRRLQTLAQCKNGFELAERDLEFRGPGEVYGIRQSGYNDQLKVAKLTDYIIIKKSKTAVEEILHQDEGLNQYPLIRERLKKFEMDVHWE